ncbi:hypothetical protein D7Z26_21875 [Cohnella endophytica]|uniref:Uncharacterized protein n=1 Tax=Cohnella endophytica TaxID=2419778 RepID=A0A494XAM3_9BACL|nr:hypothetical protein [Cohnella endophytica]RKP47867.1 hypothetical protein D7Z26_21875 [Cohnella endophytica]
MEVHKITAYSKSGITQIAKSRKETHKRNKIFITSYQESGKPLKNRIRYVLHNIFWTVLVSGFIGAFINLAAFSYITNNYKSILEKEVEVNRFLGNMITTTTGIDSVAKQKFHVNSKLTEDNGSLILYLSMIPVDNNVRVEDYKVIIMNKDMNLNDIQLELKTGDKVQLNIYDKKTGDIVNNLYSVEFSETEKTQITNILKSVPTSRLAKWFLNKFK